MRGSWLLGDALAAEGLHQVLDAAGGDTFHIGLSHDGEQGALAAPLRFEEGNELPTRTFGDLQFQAATRVS